MEMEMEMERMQLRLALSGARSLVLSLSRCRKLALSLSMPSCVYDQVGVIQRVEEVGEVGKRSILPLNTQTEEIKMLLLTHNQPIEFEINRHGRNRSNAQSYSASKNLVTKFANNTDQKRL
jgi:hypothetical protein